MEVGSATTRRLTVPVDCVKGSALAMNKRSYSKSWLVRPIVSVGRLRSGLGGGYGEGGRGEPTYHSMPHRIRPLNLPAWAGRMDGS